MLGSAYTQERKLFIYFLSSCHLFVKIYNHEIFLCSNFSIDQKELIVSACDDWDNNMGTNLVVK